MEKATRSQSGSTIWRELRKGRIVAFKFHKVYFKMRSTYRRTKLEPVPISSLLLTFLEPKGLKCVSSVSMEKKEQTKSSRGIYENGGLKT